MRKILALFVFSATAFAQSGNRTSDPINVQAMNYYAYVGVGNFTTVQLALTDRCAKNGGFGGVVIEQGATDGPTLGGEASYTINGCTNSAGGIPIFDERSAAGEVCYAYSNDTAYVQAPCTAAVSKSGQRVYPGIFLSGDSTCVGAGATANQYGWCNQIGAKVGNQTNVARAGDQAADQAELWVYPDLNPQPNGNNVNVIENGINDANTCGATTGCENNFSHAFAASIGWASIPNTQKITFGAQPSSVSMTGTWVTDSTLQTNLALQTQTPGSTLTYTEFIASKAHYITWMAKDGDTASATLSCSPSGGGSPVITDTLNAFGFNGQVIDTQNGTTETPFLNRYTTSTAITLTCVVTPTVTTGNFFSLVWAGTGPPTPLTDFGQQNINAPTTFVSGVIHQQNGANDSTTAIYNTLAQTTATNFNTDGLAVYFVDARTAVSAVTDMAGTATTLANGCIISASTEAGLHPNGGLGTGTCAGVLVGGHTNWAAAFLAQMLPGVPALDAMFPIAPANLLVLPTINPDINNAFSITTGYRTQTNSGYTSMLDNTSEFADIHFGDSAGDGYWDCDTSAASGVSVFANFTDCQFHLLPGGWVKKMQFLDFTGAAQSSFMQTIGTPQRGGSASSLAILAPLTTLQTTAINGGLGLDAEMGFASLYNSGASAVEWYSYEPSNYGGWHYCSYTGALSGIMAYTDFTSPCFDINNDGSLQSPRLVTPALGTPASGVLTNTTGLPAASVVAGALANGMTATTQAANDNSTKVATTAYADRAASATGNPFATGVQITGTDSAATGVSRSDYVFESGQTVIRSFGPNSTTFGGFSAQGLTSVGGVTAFWACPPNLAGFCSTNQGWNFNNSANTTYPICVGGSTGACLMRVDVSGNETAAAGTFTTLKGNSQPVSNNNSTVPTTADVTIALAGYALATKSTWTPTDQSGAALTFTGVSTAYSVVGNMVFVYGRLTFPTPIVSTAAVTIGGLPVTVANANYGTTSSGSIAFSGTVSGGAVDIFPIQNSNTFNLNLQLGAANITNTMLAGQTVFFSFSYPAS